MKHEDKLALLIKEQKQQDYERYVKKMRAEIDAMMLPYESMFFAARALAADTPRK